MIFNREVVQKSEFLKNVLILTGGTIGAQILNFGMSPVLSRIFDPEEFAEFGLFIAIATQLSMLVNLRLDQAIPIPKDDHEAGLIANWGIKLTLIISLFALLVFFIFHFVREFFFKKEFETFLYWVIPAIMVMGFLQVLNYYSIRFKSFQLNSTGRIISSGLTSTTSALIGFLLAGSMGLILGFLIGQLGQFAWMARKYWKEIRLKGKGSGLSWQDLRKKYKDFIYINTLHAFVDSFELTGVIFVLEYFFEDNTVGWFFFAYRLLKMPLNVIGAAVYQVFLQKAAESFRKGENIRAMVWSIYKKMFLLGIVPFGVLMIFGEELFSFVFGEKWAEAGIVASIITPWLFTNFIISPVSCVALIHNQQKVAFLIGSVGMLLRIVVLILFSQQNDFFSTMFAFSMICTLQMIFFMVWYLKVSFVPGNLK